MLSLGMNVHNPSWWPGAANRECFRIPAGVRDQNEKSYCLPDDFYRFGRTSTSLLHPLALLSPYISKYIKQRINLPSHTHICRLKVIHHPLYSMNKFVTNKSKLSQDGAQVFRYMG